MKHNITQQFACTDAHMCTHSQCGWDDCWSRYTPSSGAAQFTVWSHHAVDWTAKPRGVTPGQYSESLLPCLFYSLRARGCAHVCLCVWVKAHLPHVKAIFFFFTLQACITEGEIYGCLLHSNQVPFSEVALTPTPHTSSVLSATHNTSSAADLHNSTGYQQSQHVYH